MRYTAIALALMACVTAKTYALPWGVLGQWNFDTDTVGAQPAGWNYSGAASNTSVQSGITGTPSSPNVYRLEQTGQNFLTAAAFTPYGPTVGGSDLEIEFDLSAESFVFNNSAGFELRLFNSTFGGELTAGDVRFLSSFFSSSVWGMYNGYSGYNTSPQASSFYAVNGNNLTYGPWHNFHIFFHPTVANDGSGNQLGVASWYVDDFLVMTENYHIEIVRLAAIDTLRIYSVPNQSAATDNVMYIDNVLVAIPEPASLTLLACGAIATLKRRARW